MTFLRRDAVGVEVLLLLLLPLLLGLRGLERVGGGWRPGLHLPSQLRRALELTTSTPCPPQ